MGAEMRMACVAGQGGECEAEGMRGGRCGAEGLRGGGCGAEGLRGGRCGWEGGAIASWRVRGWDLWGAGAVMGNAGRRRGWDGWPGQRRVDVGGVRREGVSVVGGCGGASNCGAEYWGF